MNTLIILHGWASSKKRWQPIKQLIENSSRYVKVVVPDLPGFKQETVLNKVWNLNDYIKWLEDFSSDIAEPFYLLGHSFGGRMAIKFAAKHPEKLKGLILVSSAGIKPEKTDYDSIIKLAQKGKKLSFLPFYPFFRKVFYRYILKKTDYIEAEKLPYLKETFQNVIKEDLTEHLSKIETRALIIWGDKDNMTPIQDGYLMNREIRNSKMEILKNISHKPHKEIPDVLVDKIMNFINV